MKSKVLAVRDYKIISNESYHVFEVDVMNLLNNGYKLAGGVSVTEGNCLVQAVVKYDYEKTPEILCD